VLPGNPAKMKSYVLLISSIAALGGLLFGFDTAVISGALPSLTTHFVLDENLQGWVVSSVIIGCIIGTLISGITADKLGRKKSLILTSVLFIITSLGTALATSFNAFILYRITGGIAIGAASALSPIYIAEIAPSAYRGRLVAINQLTIVVGIVLAFLSNYLISHVDKDVWRFMLGAQVVPAFLFFICIFFVPESPRWLIMRGELEKANRILNRTGQANIPLTAVSSSKADLPVRYLLKNPYRKLLAVGVTLGILQQFTGINVIMYYAPVIFEKAGFADKSALLQTVLVGVVNLVFTIAAMLFIDRWGRKPLLLLGSLLMSIFLAVLSYSFYVGSVNNLVTLIAILGFIASFAATFGPVVWVLISEIYPNSIRGTAVSITTFALWVAAFIVSYTFPLLLKHLQGTYTFILYALINFIGFVFVIAAIQETKGKTLEQLEADTVHT
jgi:MFS transporter, SP family, arabinose:H+ symporter